MPLGKKSCEKKRCLSSISSPPLPWSGNSICFKIQICACRWKKRQNGTILCLFVCSFFRIFPYSFFFLPLAYLSPFTMDQNNQESRCKYCATCSSVCSFACTAHLLACSARLALLTCSAALTRWLAYT